MEFTKFKKYLKEEKSEDMQSKVIKFFKDNPNPNDKIVHKFAEDNKIDPHKLEEIIYGLLSTFLSKKLVYS